MGRFMQNDCEDEREKVDTELELLQLGAPVHGTERHHTEMWQFRVVCPISRVYGG